MSKEAKIKELEDKLKAIESQCDKWKDSGDRGACYAHSGYHKLKKELKELKA